MGGIDAPYPIMTMEGAINFWDVWLSATLNWLWLAHIPGFDFEGCIHFNACEGFNSGSIDMVVLFFSGGVSGRCSVEGFIIKFVKDICGGKATILGIILSMPGLYGCLSKFNLASRFPHPSSVHFNSQLPVTLIFNHEILSLYVNSFVLEEVLKMVCGRVI
jgi:hypothetical protein